MQCVRLRFVLGGFLCTLNLEVTDEKFLSLRLKFNYEDVIFKRFKTDFEFLIGKQKVSTDEKMKGYLEKRSSIT